MPLPAMSRRVEYESMTRGELIDALCVRDRTPALEDGRGILDLRAERTEHERENRALREERRTLQDSSAHYGDLFERAPLAYCVIDSRGVFVDANAATSALLCTNRAALLGAPLSRVLRIAEKHRFGDHIARCLEEETRVTTELDVVVRGRGEMTLQIVSSPIAELGRRASACRTVLGDVTMLKRSERALGFLAELSEDLSASLGLDEALDAITSALVPHLADACFVDLLERDVTSLRRVAVAAADELDVESALRRQIFDSAWRAYEEQLLCTRTPVFEPSSAAAFGAAFEARLVGRGLLLVPLVARGRAIGVLGALMIESGRTFTLHDFELARNIGRRVALALDNACALERLERLRSTVRMHPGLAEATDVTRPVHAPGESATG